ncbi:MAG: secretin N-terminal domain-containing protein [Pirellulaceae bacterium]
MAHDRVLRPSLLLYLVSLFLSTSITALGQLPNSQDSETIQLNLADKEDLDLQALIVLASKEAKIPIFFDEKDIAEKNSRIIIRGPANVSKQQLMMLLKSSLNIKGLAIVPDRVEGWWQVIPFEKAPQFAPQGEAKDFAKGDIFTEMFQLNSVSTTVARQYVEKYATRSSSGQVTNIDEIAGEGILIVTDYVENMLKIEQLVARIDAKPRDVLTEFYTVKNMTSDELKTQLEGLLNARRAAQDQATNLQPAVPPETAQLNGPPTSAQPNGSLQITADERTNRLLLTGSKEQIERAQQLIERIDVSLGLRLAVYTFDNVAASRIDELMRSTLDAKTLERVYQSKLNQDRNQLIVAAPEEIHERIETLKREMDIKSGGPSGQNRVRFYKLKNVKVREVLETLQAVEKSTSGQNAFSSSAGQRGLDVLPDRYVPGPNRFSNDPYQGLYPQQQRGLPPVPPAVRPTEAELQSAAMTASGTGTSTSTGRIDDPPSLLFPDPLQTTFSRSVLPGSARLTVDENTNTLIVVADPSVQALYAELIEKLDQRRPQVLIEAKVVAINANDDFSIGIEVSGGDRTSLSRLFAFTSYGLSTVTPATGSLALIPGRGFNGTLVDPDAADAVLRALASHRRSRIVSSPRILVNDNATGELSSVAEFPFTSVNASNTVSTTSFAGFAQAGTVIKVTPHISENEHLQLEFGITVNDFIGEGTAGVPPPRQTDEVNSEVTIPDGHTVIVGGLKRRRRSNTNDGIPFIENVPLLRWVDGTETQNSGQELIFVFLRPIILRDDKFKDLRFLSEHDGREACIPSDLPQSEPVLIK